MYRTSKQSTLSSEPRASCEGADFFGGEAREGEDGRWDDKNKKKKVGEMGGRSDRKERGET